LAFDVMEIDGTNLRGLPLVERKGRLREVLSRRDAGLQYVEYLTGDGGEIFAHACGMGPEGIVSKRADSQYKAGPQNQPVELRLEIGPPTFSK
jgi:bifunctional non-homologous end joining protein LigD